MIPVVAAIFMGLGEMENRNFLNTGTQTPSKLQYLQSYRNLRTCFFIGKYIYIQKVFRDVKIEIQLLNKKREIELIACFPLSGPGVVRNVSGKRVELNIDKERWGE